MIDTNIYNNKWQILIDSLLQPDYKKRFDISQVHKFLEDELNIKNKIIAEIYISWDALDEDIQIINSFENVKKGGKLLDEDDDWKYKNEEEIKENIEMKINGKIIEFTYNYNFNMEGKYIIEYSFKNNLTKTCFMFYDCISITYINFSKFNAKNVTDMHNMFYGCHSLQNIYFSNFNTKKVINMSGMFYYCDSILNLDLSNFNTENVTNMSSMFLFCNSLKNLNLSSFNTEKVSDMSRIFYFCNSLKNLNLANFNTKNVINMENMFGGCNSLKKENIITKDNKILSKFK